MKAIWKYTLETTDKQEIKIPIDFVPLSVQSQHDQPVLWCLVDPDNKMESVTINTISTGMLFQEIGNLGEFIGTCQLFDGIFVGHIFVTRNG
jgi:hypothetical protein